MNESSSSGAFGQGHSAHLGFISLNIFLVLSGNNENPRLLAEQKWAKMLAAF